MATGPPTPGTPDVSSNTTQSTPLTTSMHVDFGHSTGATFNNSYAPVTVTVTISVSQLLQRVIDHVEATVPESPEKQSWLQSLRALATSALSLATKIPDLLKLVGMIAGGSNTPPSPGGGV